MAEAIEKTIRNHIAPLVQWIRRRSSKPDTRVRFPYGVFIFVLYFESNMVLLLSELMLSFNEKINRRRILSEYTYSYKNILQKNVEYMNRRLYSLIINEKIKHMI